MRGIGLAFVLVTVIAQHVSAQSQPLPVKELLELGAEVVEQSPDSALVIFEHAQERAIGRDSVYMPTILNRLAQSHSMKGDYAVAADYSFQALRKAVLLRDTAALIDGNNNLGIDLMYQENYPEALTYFNRVEQLAAASHDTLRLGHALNNIGLTLGYSGKTNEELLYYTRAAELFLAIHEQEGYANTLLNTATAYTTLGRYADAEELYRKALTIYQDLQYLNAQSMVLQSMAENLMEAKHYNRGLYYAQQALALSETNGFKTESSSSLKLISQLYQHRKQFDSALLYLQKHQALETELFNVEKVAISRDLEKRYQTELKEQQIQELEQASRIQELESQRVRQSRTGIIVVAGLLLITAIVLFSRFRLKQRTARLLDEKNAELQSMIGFKDRLFAIVSHDLKSPLSAFQMLTDNLNRNIHSISKEETAGYLQSLSETSRDVYAMLNNLLEWALTQTGNLPFRPTAMHCDEVCETAIQHVMSNAQLKHIQILNNIPNHCIAFADPSHVIIILRNLLANAIKFSPEGSCITVLCERSPATVVIHVKDHGIGIPQTELNRLFKSDGDVHTINQGHSGKGTGIGLILCRELVERNGGKIYVESVAGEGSDFYFTLPWTN